MSHPDNELIALQMFTTNEPYLQVNVTLRPYPFITVSTSLQTGLYVYQMPADLCA